MLFRRVPATFAPGTTMSMQTWLGGRDLSELHSDEGPPFGHQGIGAWEERRDALRKWLLRWN
jgi:hypothetical protein